MDIFVNSIIVSCSLVWNLNSTFFVNIIHNLRVEIWGNCDVFLFHLVKVLVGFLEAVLLEVVLDQLSEDISESDCLLNTWSVNQLVTDLHCCSAIVAIERFSCLNEPLNDTNSLFHLSKFHVLALSLRFFKLSHGFFHGTKSFFVISIFINFYLSTCIIEVSETFKWFCFLVETNDGFHDLGVIMPILIL